MLSRRLHVYSLLRRRLGLRNEGHIGDEVMHRIERDREERDREESRLEV